MNVDDNDKPVTLTFPSGRVASKLIRIVAHNKPIGASRKSQYPYYKEEYALWIKRDIDGMIASKAERHPLIYDYNIFCTTETNISEQTLYARVTQAARYLVEQMDNEASTYSKWYEQVEISKHKKLGGVAIIWKPEMASGTELRPRLAEPEVTIPKWREELAEWLEGEQNTPFSRKNLMLDAETIAKLKSEYADIKGLFISITSSNITLVKVL